MKIRARRCRTFKSLIACSFLPPKNADRGDWSGALPGHGAVAAQVPPRSSAGQTPSRLSRLHRLSLLPPSSAAAKSRMPAERAEGFLVSARRIASISAVKASALETQKRSSRPTSRPRDAHLSHIQQKEMAMIRASVPLAPKSHTCSSLDSDRLFGGLFNIRSSFLLCV